MNTYRMIVTTETVDPNGKNVRTRETIPYIPEAELNERREAARTSAPHGSTRIVRAVLES